MDKKEYRRQWRLANLERVRAKNIEWYAANKEHHKVVSKRWHENNRDKSTIIKRRWRDNNPAKLLLHNAKARANKSGVEFSITEKDILIPAICPVLGIELQWTGMRGRTHPNTVSLDRIDPTKGYVAGNVAVISWRANCLKRDGVLSEFEAIVAYLRKSSLLRNRVVEGEEVV